MHLTTSIRHLKRRYRDALTRSGGCGVFRISPGFGGAMAGVSSDRLNEAVMELRRLTNDQLFQSMERLCEVDDISGGAGVSVEGVRRLKLWSAGCLHLAAELEAAARYCRLIEQELRQQIDEPLVNPDGRGGPPGNGRSAEPAGKSHRGIVLPGWLKAISLHSQPAHGPPERSGALVMASTPEQPLPEPGQPEADVAAMTLGPLEVIVAGRRVLRWNSLKARAVFQYLLIHRGRPVRRDVLMDLEWPDHTHTSARNNLNVALHSLRNTLDGPWQSLQPVVYQDGCYVLNPKLEWWVDRDEFLSELSQ